MTKFSDTDGDIADNARDKFKGELKKMYESENSSDSDEYRPPKELKKSKEPKERPARRPKMRISHIRDAPTPSFVMKLFDRSVDLTQFQTDTPLYPICRAWFQNNPKATNSRSELKKDAKRKEERKHGENSGLPPPLPIDEDFLPSPAPPPMVSDDFTLEYEQSLPTKEELLEKHIDHWAAVKKRIKNGMQKKERRYERSLRIIRDMYYQQVN